MRRRLVDEHDAGPPEVEHALDLLDGAPEDLAHVDGGADQRGQLAHDREAGGRRSGAARGYRRAVLARRGLELLEGRRGRPPLLRQRGAPVQPPAREILEIAGHVGEAVGPEARGGTGERVRGPVQRLRVLGAEPLLELRQRRPHRFDAPPQPRHELGPHLGERIGGCHRHKSRTCCARVSGWKGLNSTPAAPVSAMRRSSRSWRAVNSTTGMPAVAGSALSRRHTS